MKIVTNESSNVNSTDLSFVEKKNPSRQENSKHWIPSEIFETMLMCDKENSLRSANQKWDQKIVITVKKTEEEQIAKFINTMSHLLSGTHQNESQQLQSLLKDINNILPGLTLLHLKESICEKKEAILNIIKTLSNEQLDNLEHNTLNIYPLFQTVFTEAKHLKQIEIITHSSIYKEKKFLLYLTLIVDFLQKENATRAIQFIERFPLDIKILAFGLIYSYSQNRYIDLYPFSDESAHFYSVDNIYSVNNKISTVLISMHYTEKEQDQFLVAMTRVFISLTSMRSALSAIYLLSNSNLRIRLLQDLIDSTAIHKNYPTEKSILQKLYFIFPNNELFNLTIGLLNETDNKNIKIALPILLINTFGKSNEYLNNQLKNDFVLHEIIKENLKIKESSLTPLLDLLKLNKCSCSSKSYAWSCLARLLVAQSKETRSNLIELFNVSSYVNYYGKLVFDIEFLEQIFEGLSNTSMINKIIFLIKRLSSTDPSQMIKYVHYFTQFSEGRRKEASIQSLLTIPYECWPAINSLSHILHKEQVLMAIAENIKKNYDKQSILSLTNLLLVDNKFGEQDWTSYVVRHKLFENDDTYNNSISTQNYKKYGQLMHQATAETAILLEKERPDFMDVLNFARNQRCIIAHQLDHNDKENFSLLRTTEYNTPCIGIYANLGIKLNILANKLMANVQASDLIIFYTDYNDKDFIKMGKINNEKIPLSKIIFDEDVTDPLKIEKIAIDHTQPHQIKNILPHLEHLYTSLVQMEIKNEEDKVRALEISGEFFWWFCEAKPVNRGDPSIAEIMMRAVWKMKGMDNPRWQKELIPWAEVVLALDVNQFSKNFHTLFEKQAMLN